jgi:hypothetical protein
MRTAVKTWTRSHCVMGLVRERIETGCDVEGWSGGCKYLSRIAPALPLIILGLAGCGGGFRNPRPPSLNVSVNPSSITVAAGSTTTFTAMFTPGLPEGGSLSWSVDPANGGAITSAGVYAASGTAGNYTVVATWTPSNLVVGTSISGSAMVEVLPMPQLGAELNTDLIQASGAIQGFGTIQNAAIVGQLVPSVISTDPNGNAQTRSGFTIPLVCGGGRRIEANCVNDR